MTIDSEVMVIAKWKQAHLSLLSFRLALAAEDAIQEMMTRGTEIGRGEQSKWEIHLNPAMTSVSSSS